MPLFNTRRRNVLFALLTTHCPLAGPGGAALAGSGRVAAAPAGSCVALAPGV